MAMTGVSNFNPAVLTRLRENKGWNQTELARKLGVNVGQISRWEGGSTSPLPKHAERLRQLFGRKAKEMFMKPVAAVEAVK